jgi:hypothetical protein
LIIALRSSFDSVPSDSVPDWVEYGPRSVIVRAFSSYFNDVGIPFRHLLLARSRLFGNYVCVGNLLVQHVLNNASFCGDLSCTTYENSCCTKDTLCYPSRSALLTE